MKIVILYSGGLDSFLMKRLAEVEYPSAQVEYVYYKHGADSEKAEIDSLPEFVKVMEVDWLGKHGLFGVCKDNEKHKGPIYIPGRNLVFSTLAACQFLPDEIWLGSLVDEVNEEATDKNNLFKQTTSFLLSYVLSPFRDDVNLVYPLAERGWTKVDAVKWAIDEGGLDIQTVANNTVSCWHHPEDGKPCGECWQCVKRMLSFRAASCSFDDVENYQIHPMTSNVAREILHKCLTDVPTNTDEENMQELANRWLTRYEKLSIQNCVLGAVV